MIFIVCAFLVYGLKFRKRTPETGPTTSCSRCGYDLEGLPPDAVCPECGHDTPRIGKGQPITEVYWSLVRPTGMSLIIVTACLAFALDAPFWTLLNRFRSRTLRHALLEAEDYAGLMFGWATISLIFGISLAVPWVRQRRTRISIYTAAGGLGGPFLGLFLGWLDQSRWHSNITYWCAWCTAIAGLACMLAGTTMTFRGERLGALKAHNP